MKFIIISNKKNNLEKLIQKLNSKNIEIIYKNYELPYELLKKYGKDLKVIFFTNNLDKLLKVYREQTLFDVLFINYNNLYNKFTIDMLNKYLDINLNSLIINDNNNIIDYDLLSKNKINYNVILCAVINNFETGNDTKIELVLHEMADRINKRGLVILISDLFDDPNQIMNGLKHFRHNKQEVIVFHL